MSDPTNYYLRKTAVINNFNNQLRSALPTSIAQLNAWANDPNFATLASDKYKTNVATLQVFCEQAAAMLAQINWDNN